MAAPIWRRCIEKSRTFVQTWGEVIEEHKTVLWLIGTTSSALAGWAVYSARRLHYIRIEGDMSQIVDKIKTLEDMEKVAAQEKLSEIETAKAKVKSFWYKQSTYLVLAPAVCSAFLFGYMTGRFTSSFKFAKQARLTEGLRQNKVYVAVIPEQLFEAKTLAAELERAVSEDVQKRATSSWTDLSGWSSRTAEDVQKLREAAREDVQKRASSWTDFSGWSSQTAEDVQKRATSSWIDFSGWSSRTDPTQKK